MLKIRKYMDERTTPYVRTEKKKLVKETFYVESQRF
jgi:hypothetical protein